MRGDQFVGPSDSGWLGEGGLLKPYGWGLFVDFVTFEGSPARDAELFSSGVVGLGCWSFARSVQLIASGSSSPALSRILIVPAYETGPQQNCRRRSSSRWGDLDLHFILFIKHCSSA